MMIVSRFISIASVYGVALAAAALSSTASWAQSGKSEPFDFKGAHLGMSLQDWRSMPPPHVSTTIDDDRHLVAPWCSGDAGLQGASIPYVLTEAEKALGGAVCTYGYLSSVGKLPYFSSARVMIGDSWMTESVSYRFLGGELYRILIVGHRNLLPDVLDGLKAKFGEPSKSIAEEARNRLGQPIPIRLLEWHNPASSVLVEAPCGRVDKICVTYDLKRGAKAVAEAAEKLSPPDRKM